MNNNPSCVYYKDKYHNENFPDKRLSIPQYMYIIQLLNMISMILYYILLKLVNLKLHIKVKPLSDEKLMNCVKEFNLKLVGHRPITIMEF